MKRNVIIDIICGCILLAIVIIVLILNYTSVPFAGRYERKIDDELETLILDRNKHFAYYTSEGNPVGDYDLCDSFKYNASKSVINLTCEGKLSKSSPTKIKVILYDDEKIILSFNGEEKAFIRVKD